MRISTFNMRGGGSSAHWDAIDEATHPDLLSVQEAKSPTQFGQSLFGGSSPNFMAELPFRWNFALSRVSLRA